MKVNAYQNQAAGLGQLLQKTAIRPNAVKSAESAKAAAGSFANALSSATSSSANVKFSKHALQRLHSRNVTLSESQLQELSKAMDKAGAKGSKETLVLTDKAAFVVAPETRTVISAFDRNNLREGVFTKIDSAVIL